MASYLKEFYLNDVITVQQFIMYVNTLAGRSINDISQYPIVPVVRDR
jgi:hypothetical protein